jgi:hypothetical protein
MLRYYGLGSRLDQGSPTLVMRGVAGTLRIFWQGKPSAVGGDGFELVF